MDYWEINTQASIYFNGCVWGSKSLRNTTVFSQASLCPTSADDFDWFEVGMLFFFQIENVVTVYYITLLGSIIPSIFFFLNRISIIQCLKASRSTKTSQQSPKFCFVSIVLVFWPAYENHMPIKDIFVSWVAFIEKFGYS